MVILAVVMCFQVPCAPGCRHVIDVLVQQKRVRRKAGSTAH
jgi:hypothetical protein